MFESRHLLLRDPLHPACRAVIIVPARNEEHGLYSTLDALRRQTQLNGDPYDHDKYEIIVLLNNCTDSSLAAAEAYRDAHPSLHLHVIEANFEAGYAHVGTARRLLMDTAWHRLKTAHRRRSAILSTDADTHVAPDWLARNLAALDAGADAVGGVIQLHPHDINALNPGTYAAYSADRLYQVNVARLESMLDPVPEDPWPRHLEHFGASLACTTEIYERVGGLPAVKPLEDVAFIDALRKIDARIRHCPDVHVQTSARMDGRAEIGLSGQLRLWHNAALRQQPQIVESAAWLEHRFSTLHLIRNLWKGISAERPDPPLQASEAFTRRLKDSLADCQSFGHLLERIDLDRFLNEAFASGERRHAEIHDVNQELEARLAVLEAASTLSQVASFA